MSHPTVKSQSQGEHSCLINIGGSLDASHVGGVRWVLMPANTLVQVFIQPHLGIRTAHAPTEDSITYMHCILSTLKMHLKLQI